MSCIPRTQSSGMTSPKFAVITRLRANPLLSIPSWGSWDVPLRHCKKTRVHRNEGFFRGYSSAMSRTLAAFVNLGPDTCVTKWRLFHDLLESDNKKARLDHTYVYDVTE